jgi:3-oxoacyl-[acyl-carrier protein] reductase
MTVRLGLEGRMALVVGAGSEIGRACVQRLRDERMTVAFTAASPHNGESLARETGARLIACDLRDRAACDRAVEQALDLGHGRLDVLVTNATTLVQGSIEATSEALFQELLEVNLTSAFRIARACLRPMREQSAGSIINIASDTGIRAAHETAAGSVMSAGVIALAELFGAEGAGHGVRANAACPGDSVRGTDVAALVAWLACDDSAHVNGATLRIDDGAGAAMILDTRT